MSLKKTVLVIEDHLESRTLYGEILRSEDYIVIEMEHGKAALAHLETQSIPDLILMDLTFPFMSATEFFAIIKGKQAWAKIPILVVSGQWDTEAQSEKLGANGFLKKPFDIDPFIEKVHQYSKEN